MSIEIAQTIQNQLKATVGQAILWSWGQSALQALNGIQAQKLGIDNSIGALKFKVNGHHHKGHVIISLNGLDTYDVYICNVRAGKMKIKDSVNGLYFDEFGDWIDTKVEKIEAYAY